MSSGPTAPPPTPDAGVADETALLEGLRAGDPAACESFVRTHGPRALAVARRFLRNDPDAQDAVQEAFLSSFRAVRQFEGGSRLSTWLHRIVVNACLMRIRARQARPEEPIEALLPRFLEDGHHASHPPEWQQPADVLLERQEVREHVRWCIDRLPESHRTVLLLRDIEELDTAEAARLLGVSESAVKVRLHRARQALRGLLEARFSRGAA